MNYPKLEAYAVQHPDRIEEARDLLKFSRSAEVKHGTAVIDLYAAAAVMLYHDTATEVGLVLPLNELDLTLVRADHRTAFKVFGGVTTTASKRGRELIWRVKSPTDAILKWIAEHPASCTPLSFSVADAMETQGRLGWNFGEAAEAELKKWSGLYTVDEAETKDSAPFWIRPDIDRGGWSLSVKAPMGRLVVPSKCERAIEALRLV